MNPALPVPISPRFQVSALRFLFPIGVGIAIGLGIEKPNKEKEVSRQVAKPQGFNLIPVFVSFESFVVKFPFGVGIEYVEHQVRKVRQGCTDIPKL